MSCGICLRRIGSGMLAAFILFTSAAVGADFTPIDRPDNTSPTPPPRLQAAGDRDDYVGNLKVYVVEPTSSYWKDDDGDTYYFGFIGFAMDTGITLQEGTRHYRTATFNSRARGFGGVTENNIQATAVIFGSDPVWTSAYPQQNSHYFWAFYSDAAAGAPAGSADSNKTSPGFSHTVFVEEGSATW